MKIKSVLADDIDISLEICMKQKTDIARGNGLVLKISTSLM